ncbi:phosphodiester glycosidase family protein [Roseovarius ramblicola]|uniref:Phosphodiester glycosidase family protein n=1 Tax=Roseovarius ramblicola TaxID=2022336 RepID=A0ABV5HZE4_9RHOB
MRGIEARLRAAVLLPPLALLLLAAPASAASCRALTVEGADYTLCEADAARDNIRLFLNDPDTGTPLGSFANVERLLEAEGKRLAFAMNGGMYHPDRRPVGLHVEAGRELAPLVTRAGPGNFGMLPNGVLCVTDTRARVIESRQFARNAPACRHATQSGPMLVIDGALHPRFIADSDSRFVRNGVGTSADGRRAWFLISEAPVNFHRFARVFRDHTGAANALYLDGKVSRLHAPALGRSDQGFLPLGPILGVVVDAGAPLD